MIRERYFGSDTEFCAWMRSQKIELPSYSTTCGFVASDVDLHLHRYLAPVDSVGTREVQGLMFLEVKTRGGEVHASQLDTLAKVHACCRSGEPLDFLGQTIRHFGVSILYLSGTTPDDSPLIGWGRFTDKAIRREAISRDQLIRLMKFELHPDNLQPRPFRRHHKTREVTEVVKAPLGFEYEQTVKKRS